MKKFYSALKVALVFVFLLTVILYSAPAKTTQAATPSAAWKVSISGYIAPQTMYPNSFYPWPTYPFTGKISSSEPITKVEVRITNANSNKTELSGNVQFAAKTKKKSYDLSLIRSKVNFHKLSLGKKKTLIIVTSTAGTKTISNTSFSIVTPTTKIRAAVTVDLKDYFKDDSYRFYYKKPGKDRAIKVYDSWAKNNLKSVTSFKNKKVSVNKKAAGAFEKAFATIRRDKVRIEYSNKTLTGSLASLCPSGATNGTYVARMISGTNSLSHHSYGTAVDINASMSPNSNNIKNRKTIIADINKLTYLGRTKTNGVYTYKFKYKGSAPKTGRAVPNALINYLYYEIAFAPNGFVWGGYFNHTCDAMHFSVTEKSKLMAGYEKYKKVFF